LVGDLKITVQTHVLLVLILVEVGDRELMVFFSFFGAKHRDLLLFEGTRDFLQWLGVHRRHSLDRLLGHTAVVIGVELLVLFKVDVVGCI